jgi:hypothetical protein
METMCDTVPTQQNHHEVDMIDVLNVIRPRQVDPPTSVNTANEETKMDTQTLDRDIPQPQQGIGQEIEGEEMNDLPLDTENSKTQNTPIYVDIPARDIYIEDSGVRQPHWKECTSKTTPVMGNHKWRNYMRHRHRRIPRERKSSRLKETTLTLGKGNTAKRGSKLHVNNESHSLCRPPYLDELYIPSNDIKH